MNFELIYHFLIDLKFNNNRNWFKENEERYKKARQEFIRFINQLIVELKKMDKSIDVESAKDCLFRINRDVRFSKNKEPYKTNFGAVIAPGGKKSNYGGYYVHIEPDNSFLGGGVYMPAPSDLKAIRQSIFEDSKRIKAVLNNSTFKQYFNGFEGDRLKTAPKGFPKDFEDIGLLQPKHYAVIHRTDEQFWKENPMQNSMKVFKALYPLNRYLNAIVT